MRTSQENVQFRDWLISIRTHNGCHYKVIQTDFLLLILQKNLKDGTVTENEILVCLENPMYSHTTYYFTALLEFFLYIVEFTAAQKISLDVWVI